MLKLVIPEVQDLQFRQKMLSDKDTMSYNHHWGGTIDFPESDWNDWYSRWINQKHRFYRYLENDEGQFVGEIAYRLDEDKYMANVIIYSRYRNRGYGKEGLSLLCESAKANGIKYLYDDIAIDNPSVSLFLKMGFIEEYRTEEVIMLKKYLFTE